MTLTVTPEGTTTNTSGHRPVLLHPLINSLQPQPGQVIVDGTLGAGGYTAAFLERILPGGKVIAIDRDPVAIDAARKRFARNGQAVSLIQGNFAELEKILVGEGINQVDAVVLDLGISSLQLDDPKRGFAFRLDGPLDMRMDPTSVTKTAADVVNTSTEAELAKIFKTYGQERFARRIAKALVTKRIDQPIVLTMQLRKIVEGAIPRKYWPPKIHPATKTFQALRIEVNQELENLEQGLQAAINVLRPGGRFGVISFHSLEDILTKHTFHVAATNCLCPPQQPICTCAHRATLYLPSRRAIKADVEEIQSNPRSRSARLRIAERI